MMRILRSFTRGSGMKNKMLMCLCLLAATAELGAVSFQTKIHNYLRSWCPGRDKRILNSSDYVKLEAKTKDDDSAEFCISGDGSGGHTVDKTPEGTHILAIKAWEYLEINDKNIDGKYIVYDGKKHICIKHLSDYPYILDPTRWAIGTAVVAAAAVIVFVNKS